MSTPLRSYIIQQNSSKMASYDIHSSYADPNYPHMIYRSCPYNTNMTPPPSCSVCSSTYQHTHPELVITYPRRNADGSLDMRCLENRAERDKLIAAKALLEKKRAEADALAAAEALVASRRTALPCDRSCSRGCGWVAPPSPSGTPFAWAAYDKPKHEESCRFTPPPPSAPEPTALQFAEMRDKRRAEEDAALKKRRAEEDAALDKIVFAEAKKILEDEAKARADQARAAEIAEKRAAALRVLRAMT